MTTDATRDETRDQTREQTREQTFQDGLAMRRTVLGDDHVDRSLAQVSDFSRPIQELVTEYCWGVVWTRQELPPKTRSLLNLAMLTAMNRPHELGVHVRGALRNGATVSEIQEALIQTAIYAGVPAALDSFRVAERVIAEYGLPLNQDSQPQSQGEQP